MKLGAIDAQSPPPPFSSHRFIGNDVVFEYFFWSEGVGHVSGCIWVEWVRLHMISWHMAVSGCGESTHALLRARGCETFASNGVRENEMKKKQRQFHGRIYSQNCEQNHKSSVSIWKY